MNAIPDTTLRDILNVLFERGGMGMNGNNKKDYLNIVTNYVY